jgi:hypothetical protein
MEKAILIDISQNLARPYLIAKEYFKNDAQVAYRLFMHSEFPFFAAIL